jgi:hypothetical protein
LSDSLEDQQDSPDESETHLTQETISSPELQKSNKTLQVIDMGLACQDTCQTTNTKPVIADRRFDQLYIYIGEVSQDLTLRETDEVNFIRKGKQSRPPDVNTKLIEDNKCCCPGVVWDPSSSLCTCTGAWTTNEDPRTSYQDMACQVTCHLTENKMVAVDQRFGQLYTHISEAVPDLTSQVQDELTFIQRGKRGRPPDVDTSTIDSHW